MISFRVYSKTTLLIILFLSAIFISAIAQTKTPVYLELTSEDKAKLNEALTTSKNISSESQEMLTDMLNNWNMLTDNFQHMPPKIQDAINSINNAEFRAKINYTLGKLKQFDAGLKEVTDVKEDLEKAVDFYDRYAPDAENPFRSLEVMENIFKDLENLLPKEQKYEALRDPASFLVRTGLRYFREGIKQAASGLRNIQKQIKDRAANCIGFVGGDATADRSDPKRIAFTVLETGDVICYTGVRPLGGEVWSNTTGNGAYIWSSGKWTQLKGGMGLVHTIFSDWKLANGSVIPADEMIRWCNNYQLLYNEARKWGQAQFDRLASFDKCQRDILNLLNRYNDWNNLMESVEMSRDIFTAKYIFDKDGIREKTKILTGIIYDNILLFGFVEDRKGKRLSNASVTIKTPSEVRSAQTESNGSYQILIGMAQNSQNKLPLEITVIAGGYKDLKETSTLQSQCMDLGIHKLDEITSIQEPECGPNEKYDPVSETCICIDGYVRNSQGICVKESDQQETPECNDPNAELVWNDVLGVYVCNCKQNFLRDPNSGLCKPDIQNILNNSDCSSYPNTHPVWDYDRNEVYCECLPGYTWKPDYSGCEETDKLLASQADCSGYPNTHGVWDEVNKIVICDCLPGYVWDQNYTQCYPHSVAQLNTIDCSVLPNTMPVWDPVRKEPYCDCIPGYKWRDDFSGCDQITATLVVHADCSHIPNSHQVYDPVSDRMVCDCMPGFVWNRSYTSCIPETTKPSIDMNPLLDFMAILSGAANNNMPGTLPSGNIPPNQQPAVVHQSRCNDTQKAGGDAPEVHQIDLGITSGVFRFDYQTYSVKDQIIISQGGRTIFNSGCVGESKSVQVQFSGYTSVIEVRVNPNCAGSTGTQWNFTVHCPSVY